MSENNQSANPQPIVAANPNENAGQPGNPPTGDNNSGQQNPSPDEPKVEVSQKELEKLQADAGRWRAHRQANRDDKKRSRSWEKEGDGGDDDSKESSDVRRAREEANAARDEAFGLKLKDGINSVLESDNYKDLSPAVKRLIQKNPSAYIDPRSKEARNIDDALADIQDFLDGELDHLVDMGRSTQTNSQQTPPTPPASSSRPTTTPTGTEESVEGKTGASRSTTVLKNLLGRKGIWKK